MQLLQSYSYSWMNEKVRLNVKSMPKIDNETFFCLFFSLDPHIFLQIFIFFWLRFLLSGRVLSLSITVSLFLSVVPSIRPSVCQSHSKHLDIDSLKCWLYHDLPCCYISLSCWISYAVMSPYSSCVVTWKPGAIRIH